LNQSKAERPAEQHRGHVIAMFEIQLQREAGGFEQVAREKEQDGCRQNGRLAAK
jgi:hypothetical protein